MTTRIYHGTLDPKQIADAISATFNRGNYKVNRFGDNENIAVQIATSKNRKAGGDTAMTATISKVADGLSINLSKQNWFGIAASLGITALSALRNPYSLLNRLNHLAQDVESLSLEDQIWQIIDSAAKQQGTGHKLSARLSRTVCPYCLTANEIAAGRCIACGAPLGEVQPRTCSNCGFVVQHNESTCPNCKHRLN
jgi:hypothetical protein